ncbi:UbiA prenyltransferase family-domain-containing protein [Nemania serpens]|nr:UbiA prenyltransferase family-domain-containing protein [Nemania serpens]
MSFRPAGNVMRSHGLDAICWRFSRQMMVMMMATKTTTATKTVTASSTTRTTTPRTTPRITRPTTPTTQTTPIHRTPARSFSHATVSLRPPFKSSSARLKAGYFLSNHQLAAPAAEATITSQAHVKPDPNPVLPHRRRQQRRQERLQQDTVSGASGASDTSNSSGGAASGAADRGAAAAAEDILPPNASSILTTESTRYPMSSLRRQLSLFLSLSKPRLTVVVVLTAMAPYALYPVPDFLSPSIGLDTPSLSPLTLAFLTTGTALCSASATTLNMLYEPTWDAMMSRTRNRPLVRGLISTRRALAFAVFAALAGVGSLYFGVNPTVAFLGAANIALYAGVYTPLKRVSWLNTWAGAVVGGIPPLMGWAAAAGEYATGDGSFRELLLTPEAVGGWLLAALLFAWQFPHFMALSWSIRDEYKAAGHQMLCWVNPARNARVALRYSLAFLPICIGLCAAGITEWSFAFTSLPVNVWLVHQAVKFQQNQGFKGSARGLFWASVWHLPAIMVLALAQKKGMWSRVWRSVVGESALDDDDEEYDEDYDDGGPMAQDAKAPDARRLEPAAPRVESP